MPLLLLLLRVLSLLLTQYACCLPGFVSLLEVQASPQGGFYQMAPVQAFEQKPDEASHFNSLAYFAHQSHLAAATETGAVLFLVLVQFLLWSCCFYLACLCTVCLFVS